MGEPTAPTQPETALDRARARVAEFGHQGIEDPDIDFCVSLARVLTAEGTDEKLARLIDPNAWADLDRRRTVKGRIVTPTRAIKERMCKKSLALATSLLTLLAEMAEAER